MDKLYKTQLIDIVSEKAYLSREDSKAQRRHTKS